MGKDWRNNGLFVRCVIEMLGAPKDHIEKTLKDYVKSLKERDTMTVVASDYGEPEEQDQLFAMFVELDFWIKDLPELVGFSIEAMPSSVEIIEPDKISVTNDGMSDMLNDLQARLHSVDKRLKDLSARNSVLETNAQALATNIILLALKGEPKTVDDISNLTGIAKEKCQQMLPALEKKGSIRKEGDTYTRA